MMVMTGPSIFTMQALQSLGQPFLENVVKTAAPPRLPMSQRTTSCGRVSARARITLKYETHHCDEDCEQQHQRKSFQDGKLFVEEDIDEGRQARETDRDQSADPALYQKP